VTEKGVAGRYMKYVFALMDDETRFWLASEIADSKYVSDVRKLLMDGREL
jgi:hypothetical protein